VKDLKVVIISGQSGSGKSYAIKCFEDLGFFCVDNLPPPLIPKFVDICSQSGSEIKKIALGIDIRERSFLVDFISTFDRLKADGFHIELLFLEARDEVLVSRFSETRRPHPLARNRPVLEAIKFEKERLSELRKGADKVIDTSEYNVHKLKEVITKYYITRSDVKRLNIFLISFGYKYGNPYEADLLFDVRFLVNPNFVSDLRLLSGDDPRIEEYIMKDQASRSFINRLTRFLEFLFPLYEKEGRSYLTLGIGCTGGRHRSVVVANIIGRFFNKKGLELTVRHRDIGRV
jgi:UPF0042 nucleotide-binding protein